MNEQWNIAASDGADYMGLSKNLTFTVGTKNNSTRAMKCIEVVIVDSPSVEEAECFTVILTTSSEYVTLGDNITTVYITDTSSMQQQ